MFGIQGLLTGQYWLGTIEVLSTVVGAGVVFMLRRRGEKSHLYLILLLIVIVPRIGSFLLGSPLPAEVLWFLALPLPIFFLLGYRSGVWLVAALLGFVVVSFVQPPFMAKVAYSTSCMVFFSLSYVVVAILSYHTEYLRARQTRLLADQKRELESNYTNINTIRGLIPVCSNCKAVRDDQGFWQGIEEYLNTNLEVELTHGICNDCLKKHFPGLYDEVIALSEERSSESRGSDSE